MQAQGWPGSDWYTAPAFSPGASGNTVHHVVLDQWSRGASPLHRRDPRAKIAPLLVLLIVFLITTQVIKQAVPINLPNVRYEPTMRQALPSERTDRLTITTVASNARTDLTPNSSSTTSRSTACWNALTATQDAGSLCVQLESVTFIDAAGKELLRTMHEEGAALAAAGCMTRAILEELRKH